MDHLAAVGDPELRVALLFARSRSRAVTADELAAEAGLHRNVARSRLERLVEAGLLAVGYERRTGRTGPGAGRPAKTYSVVPQLETIEFPEGKNESLAGVLSTRSPRAAGKSPCAQSASSSDASSPGPRSSGPQRASRRASNGCAVRSGASATRPRSSRLTTSAQ